MVVGDTIRCLYMTHRWHTTQVSNRNPDVTTPSVNRDESFPRVITPSLSVYLGLRLILLKLNDYRHTFSTLSIRPLYVTLLYLVLTFSLGFVYIFGYIVVVVVVSSYLRPVTYLVTGGPGNDTTRDWEITDPGSQPSPSTPSSSPELLRVSRRVS